MLDRLRGGLIVSVQAKPGSPLDDPRVIAAMAEAAAEGGAAGLRVAGRDNLRAVREAVELPIVGIVKREYPGFEPYITPTTAEVAEILECGAEIVAFDATARERPMGESIDQIVASIHAGGAAAMADCATERDGTQARTAGADILASTLHGYTKETREAKLPGLQLVGALHALGVFVVCEGGVHSPSDAAAARQAGADAVVVGTAITNLQWVVSTYVAALGSK